MKIIDGAYYFNDPAECPYCEQLPPEREDYFYHLEDDLKAFPYCWCYAAVGGRSTGKTYGALDYARVNRIPFAFMKRTKDDVKLLCAGTGRIGGNQAQFGADFSPFVPINRDKGCNVKAFSIQSGIGAFWECDDDNEPLNAPIGQIFSLNSVSKIKGFNMEDRLVIMDEYIADKGDRVNRKEGEQLLKCYDTIARDTEERTGEPVRLVLLANASQANCPINETLEVVDHLAYMDMHGYQYCYLPDRLILLHRLYDERQHEARAQRAIYKGMAGTKWLDESLGNHFANDDFSMVQKINLKGYRPVCSLQYKRKMFYIYQHGRGDYYMTSSKFNDKTAPFYDLDREAPRQAFYFEQQLRLKEAIINDSMLFASYHMYDIIMNFKKIFLV